MEFSNILQKGITLHKKNKIREALKIYKKLFNHNKKDIQLLSLLATAYIQLEDYNKSVLILEHALDVHEKDLTIINNLALTYQKLGEINKAINLYNKFKYLFKNDAGFFIQLGNLYSNIKEFDSAIENYNLAINIDQKSFYAYMNIGNVFAEKKFFQKAIDNYKIAININPNFFYTYVNLGNILVKKKLFNEAINNYKISIKLNKNFILSYLNLNKVLYELRKFKEIISNCEYVINLDKNNIEAYYQKATAYNELGKYYFAIKYFKKVIDINPEYKNTLGSVLLAKSYICDWDSYDIYLNKLLSNIDKNLLSAHPATLLIFTDKIEYHHKLNAKFFLKKDFDKKTKSIVKTKKINVGYFSADFSNHAVMRLMKDVFKYHDKQKFNIFAFSFGPRKFDQYSEEIKKYCTNFFDIKKMNVENVLSLCDQNNIDIAIDLMGLTQFHRIELFEQRLAPIQVNWLGYPGTLGVKNMDYLIADKIIIPEKNKKYYFEKILYLPNCYQQNSELKYLHSNKFDKKKFGLKNDSFVYSSFNSQHKITPNVFRSWMKILQKTKKSILWILIEGINARKNILKEAKKMNINEDRIIFAEKLSHEDHLNRLNLADLFLDTFPYNAHTTTSDSLRMGVPVVTLQGETFASRVASSILAQFKLFDLITTNEKDYINKAVEIYNNKNLLDKIKTQINEFKYNSTLYNCKIFTKNLENIYHNIYHHNIFV